ncbi:hypothetical protein [Ligilactobacillus saerimneri]|uniref:hypothetical protein n=1 Tax=Ligilactobacillus saerimneri TaxID=228229 RepID=UPI00242DBA11|nr:hypothetical protein [Ligilactobacillus saerimneri]
MKRGPRERYYYLIAKGTLEEVVEEFSEETKRREVEQLDIIYVNGRYVLSAVTKNKKSQETD